MALTVIIQKALLPHPGIAPFVLFFFAVAFTAWLGGRLPGFIAVALSACAANYLFIAPSGAFNFGAAPLTATGLFVLSASAVAVLTGSLRHALHDADARAAALRASEEKLKVALDAAQMGTWERNLVTGDLRCSERCKDLFALPPNSIPTYEGFLASLHPDDRERIDHAFRESIRTNTPYDAEMRVNQPDGSQRWVAATGRAVLDDEGVPVEMNGVARDVTERKRVEQELSQSEERLRTTLDAIPQLAWVARADGHIYWYNQQWYEYTGTTPQQMEGWGWQSVHDPEALPKVLESWKASIATGEPLETEFPLRGADGRFRRFLTRVLPLKDSDGRVVQWFGTNTDITELVEAQAALRNANERLVEADRRKDEFLGVLSHELRNPLAPIHMSLYLLNRAGGLTDPATKALGVIERQAKHMSKLVDDLLDVTRVARGKVQLRRVKCDVAELVRSAVEDQRAVMDATQLRVEVSAPPGHFLIEADPTRVSQMIGNLLQNATKFTPAGGSISVSLAKDEAGHATIEVADTGVGMDEATLGSLFTPFAQADRTLARSRGGLGLGLALVKGLAELQGGDVRAESAGPGKGARFLLRFPLLGAQGAPVAIEPRPRGAVAHRRGCKKVLVIEDNADTADTLSEALELAGHEVEIGRDGNEGVLKAEWFNPDAVLCDIGLPGLDGYEVARRLRRAHARSAPFLIALTGYALPEDKRRAKEAGFDEHLAKPPDLELISQLLTERCG